MPIRPLKFSLWCSSCTASIGQRSSHKICIFSHILHSLTSSHTFDTYSLSLHINHIYITTVSNHLSPRTQQTDAAATNKSISPLQFEISAPFFGGVWSKWRSSSHTANLSPQAFCWFCFAQIWITHVFAISGQRLRAARTTGLENNCEQCNLCRDCLVRSDVAMAEAFNWVE